MDGADADQTLSGWIVTSKGDGVDVAAIGAALAAQLPAYVLPHEVRLVSMFAAAS